MKWPRRKPRAERTRDRLLRRLDRDLGLRIGQPERLKIVNVTSDSDFIRCERRVTVEMVDR